MQKAFTLLAAGLLASTFSIHAQTAGQSRHPRVAAFMSHIQALKQRSAAQLKITGTGERLLAQAGYGFAGSSLQLVDTSTYHYGYGRGSAYDFGAMAYRNAYYFSPYDDAAFIDHDTTQFYDANSNMVIGNIIMERNTAGKITRVTSSQFENEYIRNAQGAIVQRIYRELDPSTMQLLNSEKNGYAYDAQGRLVRDTFYKWVPSSNSWELTSLDSCVLGAGNLPVQFITSAWNGAAFERDARVSISYNAANLPTSTVTEYWGGTSYEPAEKDTTAYGVGNMQVYWAFFERSSAAWVQQIREVRHLNAAGLPDSVRISFQNPFTSSWDSTLAVVAYNAGGQPVTYTSYRQGIPGPASISRYYYETYQTSQGIAGTTARKPLRVYPNPVTGSLSFRPENSGRHHCALLNAAGQTVMTLTIQATAGQPIAIPMEQLAPGQYFLQVQDVAGTGYQAGIVKK